MAVSNLNIDGPVITVLLCAYNEQYYLPRTLQTLIAQDIEAPYEIVVVDNNSTDETAEVARRFAVKLSHCSERGKIPAMRVGLNASSGPIVAVADADTEYPPNWLTTIFESFESNPDSMLVFGTTAAETTNRTLTRLLGYATNAFIILSLRLGVVCSIGFNFAARRDVLSLILKDLEHYAFTGWAIGTETLRRFGKARIVFARSLRVPKCMRRYESGGYLSSTMRWVGQWMRLLIGTNMNLMERDYFGIGQPDDVTKSQHK